MHQRRLTFALLLCLFTTVFAFGLAARAARAADEGRWSRIDDLVNQAMHDGKVHGAIVVVGQRDKVLYEKVFGYRAIEPQHEAMTLDTIFDAASLTKVIATTTSAMLLL